MKLSKKELFRWADQIPEALWSDLRSRSPQEAADMVGAAWNGETYKVPMIGIDYTIDPANKTIKKTYHADKPVSYQAGVALITTLATSKGVPPSGRMTVPQELPGGRMFFTGAHSLATGPLAKSFEKNSDQLRFKYRGCRMYHYIYYCGMEIRRNQPDQSSELMTEPISI